MISDLRRDTFPAKPASVSVVSNSDVMINSNTPVTVLSGQIELTEPSKVLISGVINGTFNYVTGIAVYLDNVPLNARPNGCHSDCMQMVFGNGHNSRMLSIPFEVATDILGVGIHEVRVATLSRWGSQGSFNTYVNNRSDGLMASSSTLNLRAI